MAKQISLDGEGDTIRKQWFSTMCRMLNLNRTGIEVEVMNETLARELLEEIHWEEVVMLACAWAYRDRIAYRVGEDTYRTVMKVSSHLRLDHLAGSPDYENAFVNELDLCHSYNNDDALHRLKPIWILFTSLHRYPMVSGIVPLPKSTGALFAKQTVSWEPADTQEMSLTGLRKFFTQELQSTHAQNLIWTLRP